MSADNLIMKPEVTDHDRLGEAGEQKGIRRHNLVSVLSKQGFRRLLTVRIAAQLADGFFQAGLAGSVLFNPQQAANPAAIAAGFAVILLPYSLIGPYIGLLLDRWSRKKVIILANIIRAVLVIFAATFIWQGLQNFLFIMITLLIIGLGRLSLAALAAATPHVVENRRLVTANALTNTLGSVGFSAGLGSVALLVLLGVPATFHGYAFIASLAPLGYASAAIIALYSFEVAELGPEARKHQHFTVIGLISHVYSKTAEGVRHLSRKKIAAYALMAQSIHRIFFGLLSLSVLLRYRSTFADNNGLSHSMTDVGGAVIAGGLGMLIAALITPPIARIIGNWRWIGVLLGITAIAVAIFGISDNSILLLFAIAWVSIASQGIKIVVDTLLQHECDDDYRGRVFSVSDTLFNLCFVCGTYIGAFTLPSTGYSPKITIIVAIGYTIATIFYFIWNKRIVHTTAKVVLIKPSTQMPKNASPVSGNHHKSRCASA